MTPGGRTGAGLSGGRRRLAIGALLLAALGLAGPPFAFSQYSVSPVIVQLAAADSAETIALEIRNEGSRPLQLRLYAMDFEQAPEGKHSYTPWGTHDRSCRGRMRVMPDAVSVPPHSARPVSVHMEAAPSTRTCWSMLFVEAPARSQSGFYVNLRIGVKVYGLAGTPNLDGELASSGVEVGGPRPALTFAFRNRGDWPLRPEGEIEIRRFDGDLVEIVEVEAFSVLPEHVRRLTVALPDQLAVGRYLAIPILDYGGDYLAGSQVTFRVP